MRVTEQYYGPVREHFRPQFQVCSHGGEYEGRLRVEIDGREYGAQIRINEGGRYGPPAHYVMRDLQQMVLREIEKQLFG